MKLFIYHTLLESQTFKDNPELFIKSFEAIADDIVYFTGKDKISLSPVKKSTPEKDSARKTKLGEQARHIHLTLSPKLEAKRNLIGKDTVTQNKNDYDQSNILLHYKLVENEEYSEIHAFFSSPHESQIHPAVWKEVLEKGIESNVLDDSMITCKSCALRRFKKLVAQGTDGEKAFSQSSFCECDASERYIDQGCASKLGVGDCTDAEIFRDGSKTESYSACNTPLISIKIPLWKFFESSSDIRRAFSEIMGTSSM